MKLNDKQWINLTRYAVDYIHKGQRVGESYMNALFDVSPDLYKEISNTKYDPYHDDSRLSTFINFLNCNERKITLEDIRHVELILIEAKQYGLEWEVKEYAERFLKNNPEINYVKAYNDAYDEWIK
jgi:hypothetical protein